MPYKDPEARKASVRRHYESHPEYYRERNRRVRLDNQATIRAAKEAPCHDCGQRFPYYVMDLDHRPGQPKLFELARACWQGRTRKAVAAEIAKCDVVCANCHRERTHQRSKPDTLSS